MTMKIKIKSDKTNLNYVCINDRNQKIKLSGNKENVSPMESVLMAAAACSAIDIELILKKMRQPLEGIEVEVEGLRKEIDPKIFTEISIIYHLKGNIKEIKASDAVIKSVETYCSVINMLQKAAIIKYSFQIHKN